MRTTLLLLSFVVSVIGCRTPGEYARLSTSSSYQSGMHLRVLALPFTTEGNPTLATNSVVSDEIASALIQKGFNIIDPTATVAQATTLGIDLSKALSLQDLQQLSAALRADALLTGTITYAFAPRSAGTNPITISTDTNGRGRPIGIRQTGGDSYDVGEHYYPTAMSAKIVSAKDYEVLISALVNSNSEGWMSQEIADALRERL